MFKRLTTLSTILLAYGPLAAQPAVNDPSPGQSVFSSNRTFDRSMIVTNTNFRMYADPVIQAELGFSEKQKARIARIPDEMLLKFKNEITKEQKEEKAEIEKRTAQLADATKKLDRLLEKHLTAEQQKRFQQLVVQARGLVDFATPDVVTLLGLTDEQRARLVEIQRSTLTKFQKEHPYQRTGYANAADLQKRNDAWCQHVQEAVRQFVETFTPEQKKLWADLIGEPSDAAKRLTSFASDLNPAVISPFTPGSSFVVRWTVLNNHAIRDELKLNDQAKDAVISDWQEIGKSLSGMTFTTPGLTSFTRLSFSIPAEATRVAALVLTEPQTERLKQIQFQLARLGVFQGRRWADSLLLRLHLTPAQYAKIDTVLSEASLKTAKLPNPNPFGNSSRSLTSQQAATERNRNAAEIQRSALSEILATFDAGQLAVWKECSGDEIDLNKVSSFASNFFRRLTESNRNGLINALSSEANAKIDSGEYATAIAMFNEALRVSPNDLSIRTRKASLLSICPSEWIRDGKQAVELMKGVMAETKKSDTAEYLAIAAAYAETGQFDEAVTAQKKAIELQASRGPNRSPGGLSNDELKAQYETRLKLYQNHKPYYLDPPKRNAKTAQ